MSASLLSQPQSVTDVPSSPLSNAHTLKTGGFLADASQRVLVLFYLLLLSVTYVWNKACQVSYGTLARFRRCYMFIVAMIESALEFSQNVKHYLILLRKVFQYRMYKNMN